MSNGSGREPRVIQPSLMDDHVRESHQLHSIEPNQLCSLETGVTPATVEAAEPLERKNANGLQDQTSRLPFQRLIIAYTCLAAIYFISMLDINSVATALPTISRSLHTGSSITWAGTAYLVGQTVGQPLYGRLSDIFGRKPILLGSVGFLIVGDVLCGFAQNQTWLFACRALSGIGGGGISSLVQIVVSDLVSMKDRGKYQGLLSGAIGLGSAAGPFMAAGILRRGDSSSSNSSWRWIFWVPPILAAVCSVFMALLLPLKPVGGAWGDKLKKIDWFGLLAAVAAILFLLIPVNSGGIVWPWHSAIIITMLALAGVFLAMFALIERRVAKIPMIPFHLFAKKSTATIYLQSALYNYVWQVDMYFLPIYFQEVRGFSPLRSAALILPLLLLQSVAGVITGPVMAKIARFAPMLYGGMVLWLIGAGLKVTFSLTTPMSVCVIVLIIEGAGIGFVFQPALVALQALSEPQDRAVVTSTRNLMRMLGSVVGIALSTAVQYSVTQSALPADLPAAIRTQVEDGSWQRNGAGSAAWDSAILSAKMKGTRAVFIIMVPLIGICLLGCYFIPNAELTGDEKKQKKQVQDQDQDAGKNNNKRDEQTASTAV